MTVASDITLRRLKPISPWHEQTVFSGMTFGCGPAGYDIRLDGNHVLLPGGFLLAAAIERFDIPINMIAFVHDKSTWCRKGVAVQNTVLEPGWQGHLTLELTNHGHDEIGLSHGVPIAQVVFHLLDYPTSIPYKGKYQNAPAGPQEAIFEPDTKA